MGLVRCSIANVGWRYDKHAEEWRAFFARHLENFISRNMHDTATVPEEFYADVTLTEQVQKRLDEELLKLPSPGALSGIWKVLAVCGINVRRLPHLSRSGVTCYQLPFGLLMLVSAGERLYPTSAAREYAHGSIVYRGEWLSYIIIGPSQ